MVISNLISKIWASKQPLGTWLLASFTVTVYDVKKTIYDVKKTVYEVITKVKNFIEPAKYLLFPFLVSILQNF